MGSEHHKLDFAGSSPPPQWGRPDLFARLPDMSWLCLLCGKTASDSHEAWLIISSPISHLAQTTAVQGSRLWGFCSGSKDWRFRKFLVRSQWWYALSTLMVQFLQRNPSCTAKYTTPSSWHRARYCCSFFASARNNKA